MREVKRALFDRTAGRCGEAPGVIERESAAAQTILRVLAPPIVMPEQYLDALTLVPLPGAPAAPFLIIDGTPADPAGGRSR